MRHPKSLSIATFATLAFLSVASVLRAGNPAVDLNPLNTLNPGYCPHQMTGTATYALASARTLSASSVVDLGLFGCFCFSISTTANAVQVWVGNQGNTYTANAGAVAGGNKLYGTALSGSYCMPKVARYVWFVVPKLSPSISGPNYVTPPATSTSVWYYTPTNWPN